ncbi:MAG TPA: carboxypeptidase M32 [Opitutaceae bacterium]|nr:carboxypeptidase M32 [Opitutaceae bacterium]
MSPAAETLVADLKRANVLASVGALLGWDEQVFLPPAAADRRAEQAALLAELQHREATNPRIGDSLAALEALGERASDDEKVLRRHARKDYDRLTKLPPEFVAEKARLDSESYHAWAAARAARDFPKFAPFLQRQLEMAKREAQLLGLPDAYDHALDKHDPGMTAARFSALFAELKRDLVPLARRIVDSPVKAPHGLLRGFSVEAQREFLREVTTALGFDYGRGRIDVSLHPFCSGDGFDVRMTTRFDADNPLDSLFSAIHETGHGLYDQGLPREWIGTPLGEAVGMGIHESQSRLWENQIARSRPFWRHWEPKFRAKFAPRLDGVSSDALYLAINEVAPTLIRVDSDEVTYNLHIILRFEIEQRLFRGELAVADLPAAWNALAEELLGLAPAHDGEGCLQDVHWSGGAFGYFPSYCLGNMIAAQLWYAAQAALSGLEEDFAAGKFERLLGWLRAQIHTRGRRLETEELVRAVTGEGISPRHLVRYLGERYLPLYGA